MKTRTWLGLGLGAAMLCPSIARAAGADDKAAAQALFDDGRKLMEQGKYAEACPKLESSERLDPGAGTLLNLAACYDKNGQTASAWVTYTDAATASQDRHPDWAARATARAKALFPGLSHLTVDVPNAPDGLEVKRDGKVLESGSYGTAMPVDPGHHMIDATAPGKLPFHQEVDVGARGAQSNVTVKLDPAPVATVQHPEEHPTTGATTTEPALRDTGRGNGMRIAGLTVLGVGVAGVIVGGVFGGLAIGKKNDAAGMCLPDFSKCTSAGKAVVDDGLTFANVSTVAFIAGGVLAAVGLVVFLVAPSSKERVAVSIAPTGVILRGTF
ncbi:MAG TPA: hypothetical protein VGH28_05295 [Polyangiaceae bacterium]|jgi:hypothetical protein